ncbi:hypothetical protein OV079_30215 [Nannocystis pusilla]|uniref:Lipoprotein n=1 Tax=Nannocystis pusilla TaxID=889268 RepID=A0A9X3J169_9BACT|nr:hypothetical protein [Nannocystis pusilla]MCY1009763.1 hypothetical protein [Nannocystis pusilla]
MKMRMIEKVGFVLGVTAMFGACASEPEGELELRDDTGCPNCGNGSNSAHANEYPLDKLSLSGEPNEAGIAAGDARRGRGPLHLADLHAADGDDGAARVDELAPAPG